MYPIGRLLLIQGFQLEYSLASFVHFIVLNHQFKFFQEHVNCVFIKNIGGDSQVEMRG